MQFQLNQRKLRILLQAHTMLRIAIEKHNGVIVCFQSANARSLTMLVIICLNRIYTNLDIAVKKKKFVPGIGSYKETEKGY